MYKSFLLALILGCIPLFSAYSEEAASEVAVEQEQLPDDFVIEIHQTHYADMPEIKELKEEEDDLYSGAEVKSLTAKISEEEKQQNSDADLDYIDDEYKLPELDCGNEKLTEEVADFILKNTDNGSGSVKNRRSRLLMARNLHNFEEIKEDALNDKDNFKTKATLMHLRINEHKEIYKICASKDNKYGNFSSVYLIIYPYYKYYKVVVTNLVGLVDKSDEATFIHNW